MLQGQKDFKGKVAGQQQHVSEERDGAHVEDVTSSTTAIVARFFTSCDRVAVLLPHFLHIANALSKVALL